jgi:hypothetical protein
LRIKDRQPEIIDPRFRVGALLSAKTGPSHFRNTHYARRRIRPRLPRHASDNGRKTVARSVANAPGSIAVRNPYVDPLSFWQVELLARSRQKDGKTEPSDGDLEKLLYATLLTISGIGAGMRNTG